MLKQNIYLVYASKRSGHHGFIHWLCCHLPGQTIHLNDCSPGIDFKHLLLRASSNDFTIYYNGNLIKKFIGASYQKPAENMKYYQNIVVSFENKDIPEIRAMLKDFNLFVNNQKRTREYLVMRDPYNWVASSIQNQVNDTGHYFLPAIKEEIVLWKTMIETRNQMEFINFNEWFINKQYRSCLIDNIGATFTDKGLEIVSTQGSSFQITGNARNLGVLERYKNFMDDPIYLDLLDDELKEYSESIFNFKPEGI